MTDEQAVVVAILSRFGSDRHLLERFLDTTGLAVRAFRTAMSDGSLGAGLLDYLALDDELLVLVAGEMGVQPETLGTFLSGRAAGATANSGTSASRSTRPTRPKA